MLIRILADNPGPSFTKNLDKPFAETVKHLLRNGEDPSVAQIVKETLDAMEREKAYDTNLNTLFAMYKKERGLMASAAKQFGPRKLNAPGWYGAPKVQGFGSGGGRSSGKTLPPPVELAGRIEEARTSAKLLLQLVQSTPANELLRNELVKEFAERCTAAQRSIHGYIACDNPAPDDDTMLTLIETNEQLSLAASKHQRAMLQSRRLMGASPSPPVPSGGMMPPPSNGYTPPVGPPPQQYTQSYLPPHNDAPRVNMPTTQHNQPLAAQHTDYRNDEPSLPPSLQAAPSRQHPSAHEENPFADHYTSTYTPPPGPPASSQNPTSKSEHGGSPDPDHPGFQPTPSYLGRQESAANNLTMRGAQPPISGETVRPRTPELNMPQQQQAHDVSPVAERSAVTYRY